MKKYIGWVVMLVVLALAAQEASAITYEVGPGKPYENIGDVPWESIGAGDTVLIYYRPTPYKEKWVICAQGTESQPITVSGVAGGGGELPVIDGIDATTRPEINFWNEERSIIKVGGANIPPDCTPQWIVIENLDVKSARPPYSFTGRFGLTDYVVSAAPVYVEKCENLVVRNCILRDSGNGFFSASGDTVTSSDILIEGCYIYDNGIDASIYQHNCYSESEGILFQYNHFGALRAGCSGNNLKDRSSGMVIRYNWIEAGNRQLDLVDAADSSIIRAKSDYHEGYVYGNILLEPGDVGNKQIIHYGGDSGTTGYYRNGPLYLYNNTMVSRRSAGTTLVRLSTNSGYCDARNNILYVTAGGSTLRLLDDDGTLEITYNWLKSGWVAGGNVIDQGTQVYGTDPGFADEGNDDFHLAVGSACRDAGCYPRLEVLPDHDVMQQYVEHQSYEQRLINGIYDIGAYEGDNEPIYDLEITTSALPDANINEPYSSRVEATGGILPYTWSIISGSLPAGLSLDSYTGAISGTPTEYGTFNFTAQVTDSQGTPDSDTQALSLTVNLLPVEIVGPPFMRDGQQGVHYSQQLSADKGLAPYSWAIVAGSLPAGVSLNSSTGEISGTPTAIETANFTVEVTDSQGSPDSAQRDYSITINTASGNTYWVATNGNDTWDGSWSTPWATLQHAVDTIAGGDTILVKPGTYVGCRIESTGTAVAPKTLMAETVGTVLLNEPAAGASHNGVLEIENFSLTVAYWLVDGFEVDGVNYLYRCIDVRGTENITVRNNVTYKAYRTGIFAAFSDYVLVEDNVSYNTGEHGIYVCNSADNGTVRGNTCYGNVGNGVHMNGDASMGGDGTMTNWLVEKNVCYSNGATGINCDGVEDSTLRNNLLYSNGSKGFSLYGIDAAISSRNNRVLNNTAVSRQDGTGYYVLFIGDTAGPPVGNKLFNNILYHYSTASNRGSICIATSGETDFESNYNVVMERFGLDDNAQTLSFAEWQARGYDLDSIQASDTALFLDAANYDYHLKLGSPAVDGGTTLGDVTEDIEGRSRPQGSEYDIGCYEFVIEDLEITTTSLPDGQVGTPYSQTLEATGGVPPYTWAIISGSLPAGLSLNSSTGEISGTPTTIETANFTVEVTDSQGTPDTDQQALAITINPANLVITTTSLPNGAVGSGYSQTLEATGGVTPYNWAVIIGSLPDGLSLNSSTGEISGTPTTEETANFTVEVTDSQAIPDTDQKALSITIDPPPDPLEITTTSLPNGQVGTPYSQTLAATGGITPYSWSIVSGSLPAGLSLDSGTGEISGTPTAYGTSNFTVEVTDSQLPPDSDQQALSIEVIPEDLVITTASLPYGEVGKPYSQTLAATGGATPYSWAIISGNLPAGLSLNSSTGEISGTPTTEETANFTVEVTDSYVPPDTDQKALSITIYPPTPAYYFAASEAEETTNSDVWQTKVTLSMTPSVADDWVIIAFTDNRGDYWGGKACVRLLVDDVTTEGEMLRRPHHSTWFPYTALKVASLSVGSHTIKLQYRRIDDPEQDVYVRRSRILAIRKADLELASAASDAAQQLPTTPTDITTLNWTPATAGDYLLLYFCEFQAGWTDDLYIEASHNAAVLDSSVDETRAGNDWGTWMSVSVVSCDTSEQTAKLTAWGSATDGFIRRARIVSLRLTDSPFAGYQSAVDDTESSTNEITYQEKLTKSWDAGSAGNWLLLASAQLNQDPTSRQCKVRLQVNDTTTQTEQNRVPITNTHWVDFACMDVESLSSTTQVDIDYCSNNADSTTTIKYVHFVGLPLDAGPAPLTITTSSLPDGQIDVAYSETLAATGGITPYSWAVVSGSLPAGLSLNSSTGEIGGTPTTGGTSNFTVEVTDSDSPPSTDQQALSIYVPDDLVVTTSSLPDGQIDVAYSETLAATGGVTPYSWSIVSGSLPPGLSLNSGTGEISGTPTTGGTSNFTVRVTDSQTPADTDDQALSIYIPDDLVVTTSSLPDGQIGVAYSETLAATGGVTPYTWSIVSGSLPAGLSLNSSTGEISGTPTTGGTSNFTVRVTDSQTPADTDDQALSIYIPDDLVVTTSSLPDGTVGVPYSQTLAASGGVTPYSWAVVSGSLPAGLSLNSSTGEISGTPTTQETANFTVEVTDSQTPADSDQQALSITINPSAQPLVITTTSLPDGQKGQPYSATLQATGGVTPYTWSIVSGSLPNGLSLDSGTGVISGTCRKTGTWNFTVRVEDSQQPADFDEKPLSIDVIMPPQPLEVTTTSLPDGNVGVGYSATLEAEGGVTPYSWAVVSGSLPAGLSLNSSTGEISGTPTTEGTSNFTVEVTDSQNPPASDQQALSITINAAPDPVVITTSSLPDGQKGVAYSQTLQATGGVLPYTWSIVAGKLPNGLSLDEATGEISGTPKKTGTFNFTVRVEDSQQPADFDEKALSITIN
ncbi:MAG: putative Ig domain-containing protein [Planctomycetota bacterium]|jgi:parallel beta-helix repeat protein